MGRVAIVEPVPRQVGAKRGPRRRGHEQHPGRGHHVMLKARQRDLVGAQAAARTDLTLQHQDALSPFRASIAAATSALIPLPMMT